jgi:hypothetical protein
MGKRPDAMIMWIPVSLPELVITYRILLNPLSVEV